MSAIPGFETILVEVGILTEADLDQAREVAAHWDESLGNVLVRLGLISEDVLLEAKSLYHDIPRIHIDDVTIKEEFLKVLHPSIVRRYRVFPFGMVDEGEEVLLKLALFEPEQDLMYQAVERESGMKLQPYLLREQDLNQLVSTYYEGGSSMTDLGAGPSASFQMIKAMGIDEVSQLDVAGPERRRYNPQLLAAVRGSLQGLVDQLRHHPRPEEEEFSNLLEEYHRLLEVLLEKGVLVETEATALRRN
ncbi:MAG: hypothetical protein A2284_15985 [Deltaproteobacteria bacterium RIFOXYA12_FULL_61_11]|nr:MAG: hypothetical protein A2284_15985 [Deltaproteobacteria bacterium RIFOXYA12_FULL_61_11]